MSRCKAKTEVYSRIVGYFRPVQQWNVGKQQEFAKRKNFRVNVEDFELYRFPEKLNAEVPDQRIPGNVAH